MTESERYDYAREEVVCDSMQTVLNDGVALQEMANREPTVFGKLKQFITELIGRIRRAMKGIPGYTKEAREFAGIAGDMEEIERAFAEAAEEAGRSEAAMTDAQNEKYSIKEVFNEKGESLGYCVYLDSDIFSGLNEKERVQMMQKQIKEFGGRTIIAVSQDGVSEKIKIAENNQRFTKEDGKSRKVNHDLLTKNRNNRQKQEIVVLLDEAIIAAGERKETANSHGHGWLDNFGMNKWEHWTVLCQEKSGRIWSAKLNIAMSNTGERYFYDVDKIEEVKQDVKSPTSITSSDKQDVKSPTSTSIDSITQNSELSIGSEEKSTKKFSDRPLSEKDSEGTKLSEAQKEYFKDSKIRDEDGNLLVVYHGTSESFTVFDRTKSRANMDIQGNFFSPWEDDAAAYLLRPENRPPRRNRSPQKAIRILPRSSPHLC